MNGLVYGLLTNGPQKLVDYIMLNSIFHKSKNFFSSCLRKLKNRKHVHHSESWELMEHLIFKSKTVVDLGCGNSPQINATFGVDAFLEPYHRTFGFGDKIDQSINRKGFKFIQADLNYLPFASNSFDFAYSHHVFEHLNDPMVACKEMMRVARSGVIITPSYFSEVAFGRPYHIWFVIPLGNTIVFIRKPKDLDRPFGDHPVPSGEGGYSVNEFTNPFDILLNDGNWYQGSEKMERLSNLLRNYWYSHSAVMETVFVWIGSFNCIVIDENGTMESVQLPE